MCVPVTWKSLQLTCVLFSGLHTSSVPVNKGKELGSVGGRKEGGDGTGVGRQGGQWEACIHLLTILKKRKENKNKEKEMPLLSPGG